MRSQIALLCVGLSLVGTTACGPAPAEEPVASSGPLEREDPLYAASTKIWHSLSIPVCWESPAAGDATARGWVRNAVLRTWENDSLVSFTGWDTCTVNKPGIHIKVNDEGPHTIALGTDLNGVTAGMVLNFTFKNWSTVCQGQEQFCIDVIAVHEFGHALGFAHEQNRSDTPSTCTDAPQGSYGDVFVGTWDLDSIMNYCNPSWNNNGVLSAGDKQAVAQYYGSFNNGPKRQDAVNWGNGKIYFFNGGQYSRYDIAANKIDDYYPQPILGNWPGWPASWSDGVDAAINWGNGFVYMFRGSQYIKYDIARDTVVEGYPRQVIGSWGRWPSSWTSIDAAVMWSSSTAYFFRGSEYIQYDVASDRVIGGPRSIAAGWPGVFPSDIEYTVRLTPNDSKIYFFRGLDYSRFNIPQNKVDPFYPFPIVGWWPGVAF